MSDDNVATPPVDTPPAPIEEAETSAASTLIDKLRPDSSVKAATRVNAILADPAFVKPDTPQNLPYRDAFKQGYVEGYVGAYDKAFNSAYGLATALPAVQAAAASVARVDEDTGDNDKDVSDPLQPDAVAAAAAPAAGGGRKKKPDFLKYAKKITKGF